MAAASTASEAAWAGLGMSRPGNDRPAAIVPGSGFKNNRTRLRLRGKATGVDAVVVVGFGVEAVDRHRVYRFVMVQEQVGKTERIGKRKKDNKVKERLGNVEEYFIMMKMKGRKRIQTWSHR